MDPGWRLAGPRALIGTLVVCGWSLALDASWPQQATFRGRADLVRVDVSVLDRNRQPVRGLTAADFTVLEDGVPQKVITFDAFEIPGARDDVAPWMRLVGPDIATNTGDVQRLVVILMDDTTVPFDPGNSGWAKRIAREVVDALGPADLVSVVFMAFGQHLNFTSDRAQMLDAIDSFVPHPASLRCGPECHTDTLERLANILGSGPAGRKVVIYIGAPGSGRFEPGRFPRSDAALAAFQRANATFHVIDPRGLMTNAPTAAMQRPVAVVSFPPGESWLAAVTGGRTVYGTNTPWVAIPDVFHENSSYYMLGYQSSNGTQDGRFRKIEVRLKRPGLTIHTRSGYFAARSRAASSITTEPTDLERVLGRALPSGDLPLRLHVATFAAVENKQATMIVVTGVAAPDRQSAVASGFPGESAAVTELLGTVFDTNWETRGSFRQTLSLTPGESGRRTWTDVASSLTLRPGRYEVRLGATRGDRSGTVFLDVNVPVFDDLPLSMSDLTLVRGTAPPADLLSGDLTSSREFMRSDRVAAFVRVYERGAKTAGSVALVTRIVSDQNHVVLDDATTMEAARFGDGRSADFLLPLPLLKLAVGQYLLTIEATMASQHVERHLMFRVLEGSSAAR